MTVILGIDIGGSTTKIVGLREDGSTIERKSEPCFVWGTIFVQTKRHSLP